jgi:hypothetical protein
VAWAEVDAIGFSTSTCFPALSALIASSKCVATGVAMAIASIAGLRKRSSGLVVVVTAGYRRCTSASLPSDLSQTETTRHPVSLMKFLTRFGPQ